MMNYWGNFARTGNPSPTLASSSTTSLPAWRAVEPGSPRHMVLVNPPAMQEQQLQEERMLLWDSLLWRPRQEKIERQQMFLKATQLLLANKLG